MRPKLILNALKQIENDMTTNTTEMNFTAKDVMTLRQKTGMPMMECKQALTETGGDMKAAEEWLRQHAKGKMDTRTERATGEGRLGIAISGAKAAIVEIRTESDFTARNPDFVAMVNDVAKMALSQRAGSINPTAEMNKRIDDVRTVTRENTSFARGEVLEGGSFGSYLHHDGKRAVVVQIDGAADAELLKGICQHILFHDPMGISEKDIPADALDVIRKEAIQEAKDSGKPEPIAQKIADGKVRKYLEERTLMNQKYVLDETKSVKEIVPKGVTITRFVRYTLGAA